jgi:hypothetical protein
MVHKKKPRQSTPAKTPTPKQAKNLTPNPASTNLGIDEEKKKRKRKKRKLHF